MVSRAFCCSITHLPWIHGQPTSHLNLGMRIILFWTKQLLTLKMFLIPSSLTPMRLWNWIDPLMIQMSLHLQSLQGSYAWIISFLIILNHNLLLASNLINYGARLGCYFACTTGRKNFSILNDSLFSSHCANKKTDQSLSDLKLALVQLVMTS